MYMDIENQKQIEYILNSRIKTSHATTNTKLIESSLRQDKPCNTSYVDFSARNKVLAEASNFSTLQDIKNVPGNDFIGYDSRQLQKRSFTIKEKYQR